MVDKLLGGMRCSVIAVSMVLAGAAGPALAGETILFAAPQGWVEQRAVPRTGNAQYALYDAQHRLENGVVSSFLDLAIRIATPEAATQAGTVQLNWFPDKGDLTVHQVSILRGSEVIDVLASAKFDTLRRERGLEQRLLDGQFTATLAVPGLKVGDILRVAYTTTTADQALGKEMQLLQPLFPHNPAIGDARTRVSWPANEPVRFMAERGAPTEAELVGGYRRIEVDLPLLKAPDMPADAPRRFQAMPLLRVGTYADWQELSRSMFPHFDSAAAITPGSPLDGEVKRIMAASSDPLERAALAVRAVQDDISYLLNGLAGGNYLPQTAEDTWAKRFGDCKAKSVLLTAMLRRMGIAAEPALVSMYNGDAVPTLLPIPGVFDHMIVRSEIGGRSYWLDGTSVGTRIANIDAAPGFAHALPLTAAGSALVPIVQDPRQQPSMTIAVTSDYSAGIDLPYLLDLEVEMTGPQAAAIRPIAESQDREQLRQLRRSLFDKLEGYHAVDDIAVSYDADKAVARITATGAVESKFAWDRQRMAMSPDLDLSALSFDAERTKPEWRAIPVATQDGGRALSTETVILPHVGFAIDGPERFDGAFANTSVRFSSAMSGRQVLFSTDIDQRAGEIPVAQLPEAKRAARKLAAQTVAVVAPATAKWRWERTPAELAKATKGLAAVFDRAVAQADRDDATALEARALFRHTVFDFAGSLDDYKAIGAIEPSAQNFASQAWLNQLIGRQADELAAWQQAYDIDPQSEYAFGLARALAYAGQHARAGTILEEVVVGEDDEVAHADALSFAQALAGNTDQAAATLADALAERPDDATLLNAACWLRGLFAISLDDGLPLCTKAVERAQEPAAALDSRAMLKFRQGDLKGAISDLDAALALVPDLAASLYLRGLARQALGDTGGKADIAASLRLSPDIRRNYDFHKVAAPKS